VELHVTMSLLQDDVRIVALTADKETERTYRPEAASLVSLRHGCGAGVRGGGLAGGVREGQVAAGGGGIRQQCVKSTRDSGSVAVRRKT